MDRFVLRILDVDNVNIKKKRYTQDVFKAIGILNDHV